MQITDKKIEEYCISKSNIPGTDCLKIEDYTRANVHGAGMLIGKMEASFIGFLLRSIKAKRVLELGTFTGYSALTMAENMPEGSEIITVDVNQETVNLAKDFWGKSAHGHKIKSILGPGLEVIPTLTGKFDFVFIDADKRNYIDYLKLTVPMLSEHGMIVIDNVLWGGQVLPGSESTGSDLRDRNTEFIRAVNDYIAGNPDLYGTLMPIRDGMFLVQKKTY
ncbi:methyltransferase [Bacteriovorax stolpii]|uniref:O-methyltransferase n=1 Tax=Bacteriovorax stolpii TaxID=960 RepID=UPI0011573C1E|nr:class I SAM-dependent methyltransferase [Bacteriovorax stolpii]QDK42885.1 methyltransferase [Bacteriovorax stolpii]